MLKRIPQALLILIALSCASGGYAQSPDAATFKVGVASRHVLPSEPYEWRGAAGHSLQEIVWYPADSGAEPKPQLFGPPGAALFAGGDAAPDAKLAASPAKFPLILLSHGTGGTAEAMAWLGTALAARGYVVAAVNHPGNNARAPYTVPGFTLWWKRAQDLTVVASDLLADDEFGPRIDPRRIGAAGFSLGGYTVIELAGGITSLDQFFAACRGDRGSRSD